MSTPEFAFLLFFLFMVPVLLEMTGFQWKSTEVGTYLAGFSFGLAFCWWFP